MEVRVTVVAGAKKEKIISQKNGMLTVTTKEKAERNMANRRMREMLAEHFGTTRAKVRIITGHTSPKKRVEVST